MNHLVNPWITWQHWFDHQWCCNVQVQCSSDGGWCPCVQLLFRVWPQSSAASPSVQISKVPVCNEAIQWRMVAEAGTPRAKKCVYEICLGSRTPDEGYHPLTVGRQVCSPNTQPLFLVFSPSIKHKTT